MSTRRPLPDRPADSTDGSTEPTTRQDRRCLVLGDSAVAFQLSNHLTDAGTDVTHLPSPSDAQIAEAITWPVDWVAIMVHNDILALRYALACAHARPGVRIVVTIFDRTIGDEVHRLLDHCEVTSPAEFALPQLVSLCLDRELTDQERSGDNRTGAPPTHRTTPVPRSDARAASARDIARSATSAAATHLTGFVRTKESGARLLVVGLAGLLTILSIDLLWLTARENRSLPEGLHEAVRVVTTVGPAEMPHGATYAVFAALAMLVTVVFTAMFTAGVIDRSLGARSVGMIGPRSMPRKRHVIVVGLGQVGARLCMQLRAAGIPVVAVERDTAAPGLRLIRNLRIPTVVGHGVDRWLLDETRISKASALAAVGSDDLDNVSVAVAAHGVAPGIRIVLRAGGQAGGGSDTAALLPLGMVCDVTALTVDYVAGRILGDPDRQQL